MQLQNILLRLPTMIKSGIAVLIRGHHLHILLHQHLNKTLAHPVKINYIDVYMAGVAQLVRARGCGPRGRGFDSRRSPHFYSVI